MRKVMCSVIVGSVVFVSRELFSPIWEIESGLRLVSAFTLLSSLGRTLNLNCRRGGEEVGSLSKPHPLFLHAGGSWCVGKTSLCISRGLKNERHKSLTIKF